MPIGVGVYQKSVTVSKLGEFLKPVVSQWNWAAFILQDWSVFSGKTARFTHSWLHPAGAQIFQHWCGEVISVLHCRTALVMMPLLVLLTFISDSTMKLYHNQRAPWCWQLRQKKPIQIQTWFLRITNIDFLSQLFRWSVCWIHCLYVYTDQANLKISLVALTLYFAKIALEVSMFFFS